MQGLLEVLRACTARLETYWQLAQWLPFLLPLSRGGLLCPSVLLGTFVVSSNLPPPVRVHDSPPGQRSLRHGGGGWISLKGTLSHNSHLRVLEQSRA